MSLRLQTDFAIPGETVRVARAGVEGAVAQGTRMCGLRRSRYRGLAKTHLQHVATAAAMNLKRAVDWINDVPRSQSYRSSFSMLAAA